MNRVVLVLLLFALVASATVNPLRYLSKRSIKYNTWVVLVAGSIGWGNVRHQADICHAYHAIHDFGVPEDHIIVMMPDDVAYSSKNPYPGVLYNEEGGKGPNVYIGVPHDYTHDLVTLANFQKILLGEEMTVGSGKTLKSGPEDNVLVYYCDHGGYNSLPFPTGGNMDSAALLQIINGMKENNKFKNLVVYIEACNSGSMVYSIANDLPSNVYITTAAPVSASSYAGCNGGKDKDEKDIWWCDAYSHVWISDLEGATPDHTFDDQFSALLDKMVLSQSCSYGDTKVQGLTFEEFFGPSFVSTRSVKPNASRLTDVVSNLDLEFVTAQRAYESNPSPENKRDLDREIAIRKAVDAIGISVATAVKPELRFLSQTPCTGKACDQSECHCIYQCHVYDGKDMNFCSYACCNEASCMNKYQSTSRDLSVETCVNTLSRKLYETCGNPHPYFLSLDQHFRRLCKLDDVDMTKAIEAIEKECAAFDIDSF